jgi:hypothetical protein
MKSFRPALLLAFAFLAALSAFPAKATTYKMVSDVNLTDQAALIVQARVTSVESAPTSGRPATDYLVQIDRVLKGEATGSAIVVRVPGGVGADGIGLKIWGAPEFREGEQGLLFLVPAEDGTYRVLHLMLGAFHQRSSAGRAVALRDLSEAVEIGPQGKAIQPRPEPARDLDRFADWVSNRAAGVAKTPDYLIAETTDTSLMSGLSSASQPFTLLESEGAGKNMRWFRFDQGQSVTWRVHQDGQPGLGLDRTIAAFKVAMQVWNSDPDTNIQYTYAGTTGATGGLAHGDGTNAILFEDPYKDDPENAVEGHFTCPGGGVIAIGGPYFFLSTRTYKGVQYHEAIEADIVTNDGTECFFRDSPSTAEEVFAHELGHTLGLGHSPQSDALMRATAHADGRGARLTADDRAGIAVLYGTGTGGTGTGGGTTGNKPAAPAGLAAQAVSGTEVRLTWTDSSTNEQGFRVERKVGNGTFQEVMTVGANASEARITGLAAATAYSFRVRARNGSGFSPYSNTVSVTTPGSTGGGTFAAPTGLKALARSANEVLLTWQDSSTGETGFRVERQTAGGAFQEIGTVPANSLSALVTGLSPGTSYGFRVRAVRTGGTSNATGTVTVTTPQAAVGAGCSGGDALCLAGGRFRVEVDWRDRAGNTGRGQLARRTDQTATAWFFDSGNVELIVKILDGQTVNGNFWVFSGGLSDVEYWIRVTDLQTGRTQLYHNRQGDVRGFADTAAFPAAAGSPTPEVLGAREIRTLAAAPATVTPAASQAAAGACGASGQSLCLDGNRFQVEVRWKNQHDGGSTGVASAVPGTDNTGYFWFFDAENTELVVKVLDGTALNGKFWVFSGALTDLEYWIKVTDTATGKVRTYHNPPGNLAGVADTSAF